MIQPELFTDKVEFSALGSGSGGNSFVVRFGENALMVDVGFSRRETVTRLRGIGVDPHCVRGALITHEHEDHIRGCRVFCDEFDIPVCIATRTAERLRHSDRLPRKLLAFEPGAEFDLGGFHIRAFAVQHDAVSPVGFQVTVDGVRIGLATDLGTVNAVARQYLRDCDCLVLESNYDLDLLLNSDRPIHLRRRIAGRHGHLDNRDAAAALGELVTGRTRLVLLAHLSSECNRPELARETALRQLHQIGADRVRCEALSQDRVFPFFDLGPRNGGAWL